MERGGSRFARDLDWNLLKVFHEIVQAGGVSSAARELQRKQPALSLALKRLESSLGVVLCRRGPAGFELSDEGRLVAELCEEMAQRVGHVPHQVADLTRDVRGRLRLQFISNIVNPVLDQAIAAFRARYPRVEIFVDVAAWDAVASALLRGEVDVGVAPARVPHAELRYDFLFREVHRPYCGASHPLFGRTFDDPSALSGEAFVLTGADEPDQLTKYRLRHRLGRHVAGMSEHLEEARRLTILGLGICFLPEGVAAPEVAEGRLWPLTPPSTGAAMDVFIVTNPRTGRHLARDLFLEEVWQRLPSGEAPRRLRAGQRRASGLPA